MINYFRIVGYLEGTSFLVLLFIAMPLKYMAGQPEAVHYTGWAHGLLFILYCQAAATVTYKEKWPPGKAALAFLAAFLPFGPFVFDRKYL